ncbi:MAG: inositol monophosphatase family protein [Pirellulaceae bacterium]|nr:inositol monophosphatase family protein [Pirellulaceae bacterium]
MSAEAAISARLQFARLAAKQAGRLVMGHYDQDVAVERKSDNSPVTIADREAEQLIRRLVAEEFPDDGVLGEEFGEQPGISGFRWILDPIDGTKSFIAGVPLFGTMVGVEFEGQCIIGVVEFPALDQRIYAARGQHAWWQIGEQRAMKTHVSAVDRLADGLYVTSEVRSFAERDAMLVHEQLEAASWYSRTWGDCYGYYLLVTGRAVVMLDPVVSLWDTAALYPILKEAGATVTDWKGNDSYTSGELLATNGAVFDEVLTIIANAR